jgi:acyl carrier protein
MAFELFNLLFKTKPLIKPDFETQKPIWNDATKIESKVREAVAETLGVDISLVTPEAEWYRDLGATVDVVEIFMICEEAFGIDIPDEDAEQCETVGKLTA